MRKIILIFVAIFSFGVLTGCSESESDTNINAVIKAISELPDNLSIDDKESMEIIRNLYDALTEEDKSKVTNYSYFVALETIMENLIEEEEKLTKINEVIKAIDDLNATISLNDEEKIEEARALYDALADKDKVTNYQKLVSSEKTIETLKKIANTSINAPDEIILFLTEEKKLIYTLDGPLTNESINAYISDEEIIKIENSTITALKEGKATITLTSVNYPEDINKTINVIVTGYPVAISGDEEVEVMRTISLNGKVVDGEGKKWESSDTSIATVNSSGVVTGVSEGKVTITLTSTVSKLTATKEITIIPHYMESVTLEITSSEVDVTDKVSFSCKILPETAIQDVIFTINNTQIASLSDDAILTALATGTVTLKATSKANPDYSDSVAIKINMDMVKIFTYLNETSALVKSVITNGETGQNLETVYGSVSRYFFDELVIDTSKMIEVSMNGWDPEKKTYSLTNTWRTKRATEEMIKEIEQYRLVRSGVRLEKLEYIVYHDTGNSSAGANALAHANYISSAYNRDEGRARSWHFTVDSTSIYQHIPTNEVTWQGDDYKAYAKSIGIETCVDKGSDLYATWHRTAKLMAKLIADNRLSLDCIKQHNDFNGKDCPWTLRHSNLYDKALSLVEAEYIVYKNLKNYDITLISNDPDYVNEFGRVIKLDDIEKEVSYIVRITNAEGYDESITFKTKLPSKSV